MAEQTTTLGLAFSSGRLRLRAREHARVGDHAAAARALQAVIDVAPEDLEATLRLALHYTRSGQTVMAARTYLHGAEVYARSGQRRRAVALFDRACQLDPLQVTAPRCSTWARAVGDESAQHRLCALAQLHRSQGRQQSSLSLLRLAADVRPEDLSTLRQLLDAETRHGDRAAVQDRMQATAQALKRRGRSIELRALAQLLLDWFPRNLFALHTLAYGLIAKGESERALPLLLALQAREPSNPDTLLRLARIHASLGERVQALAALERFVWVRAAAGEREAAEVIEAVMTAAQSWMPKDPVWQRELIELGFGAPTARSLDLGGATLTVLPCSPPPPPLSSVVRQVSRLIGVPRALSVPENRRHAAASGEVFEH